MNSNWPRWISSSIVDHFITTCQTSSFKGFAEGQHRDQLTREADLFEIRVTGPEIIESQKGIFKIEVEVNILIQSVLSETDLYKLQRLCGSIAAAFTDIPVYKYGDGDELIGCLTLDYNGIQISNFGQIAVAIKLQNATVEGTYRMILE